MLGLVLDDDVDRPAGRVFAREAFGGSSKRRQLVGMGRDDGVEVPLAVTGLVRLEADEGEPTKTTEPHGVELFGPGLADEGGSGPPALLDSGSHRGCPTRPEPDRQHLQLAACETRSSANRADVFRYYLVRLLDLLAGGGFVALAAGPGGRDLALRKWRIVWRSGLVRGRRQVQFFCVQNDPARVGDGISDKVVRAVVGHAILSERSHRG